MFHRLLIVSHDLRQMMEENRHALGVPHLAMRGHLQAEQATLWFTTSTSFTKWSFFHLSPEPSFQINLASPLPLLFETIHVKSVHCTSRNYPFSGIFLVA